MVKHCEQVGETYLQHARFAIRTGVRLLISGSALIFHGMLPWWSIPDRLNLEATCEYLTEANNDREERREEASKN